MSLPRDKELHFGKISRFNYTSGGDCDKVQEIVIDA